MDKSSIFIASSGPFLGGQQNRVASANPPAALSGPTTKVLGSAGDFEINAPLRGRKTYRTRWQISLDRWESGSSARYARPVGDAPSRRTISASAKATTK